MILKSDRIGEHNTNWQGLNMVIIEYRSSMDIDVRFNDSGYIATNKQYVKFLDGGITDKYYPTFLGVGYIGDTKTCFNGKIKQSYTSWSSMLSRCYDPKYQERNPSYKGVNVRPDFLCFENFEKWYNDNVYVLDNGESLHLDKDLFSLDGIKMYSPNNCCLLPSAINALLEQLKKQGYTVNEDGTCNINIQWNNELFYKDTVANETIAKEVRNCLLADRLRLYAEDYIDLGMPSHIYLQIYNLTSQLYPPVDKLSPYVNKDKLFPNAKNKK